MFVYIFSPHGKLDTTPCKVGISRRPQKRLISVRSQYEQATGDYKIAALYEVESEHVARQVERDAIEAVGSSAYGDEDFEWLNVSARSIMARINRDERASLFLDELPESDYQRLTVELPLPLSNQFRAKIDRQGRTMTWVVRHALRKYVEEEGTSWLFERS